MGRTLQKKKNRSSIAKVRQRPKSKKLLNPRGNATIAANWDKTQTVSQNYRRLGLTSRINASTGGTVVSGPAPSALRISSRPTAEILVPTTARVERGSDGAITRIIHPSQGSKKRRPNPLQDPLNDLSDLSGDDDDADVNNAEEASDEWEGIQAEDALPLGRSTVVVAELERQSQREARRPPRKASAREREWIERLVKRHGDDMRAMFWDRKLNPMQQSEADIKWRVERWRKETGGGLTDGGTT
ncbi:MAG: hypothetical protein M1825_002675 [Sarcosagium campestre]|nr:MAG: hypothetical protein M1825_002675 [Sarcosagium campestre]